MLPAGAVTLPAFLKQGDTCGVTASASAGFLFPAAGKSHAFSAHAPGNGLKDLRNKALRPKKAQGRGTLRVQVVPTARIPPKCPGCNEHPDPLP